MDGFSDRARFEFAALRHQSSAPRHVKQRFRDEKRSLDH